jgi:hypothetical protein
MPIDVEKFKREMDEWAESEQGKAHFENYWKKIDLKQKRFVRLTEWLKHNDFDKLMYRIILEHNEEYREKCWHSGCEAYPNNKLSFLLAYIMDNNDAIRVPQIDCDFGNNIWFFKGYYFQLIHGQGTITRIYNKEDMRCILQV